MAARKTAAPKATVALFVAVTVDRYDSKEVFGPDTRENIEQELKDYLEDETYAEDFTITLYPASTAIKLSVASKGITLTETK